jgi:predicted PurR-regulated permease PerM
MAELPNRREQKERVRRLLIGGLLVLLAFLLYMVVAPFLAALAWSVIITLSLWPVYRRLRAKFRDDSFVPALLMSFSLVIGVLVPLVLLGLLLVGEAERFAADFEMILKGERGDLLRVVSGIPLVGDSLRDGILRWREDPSALNRILESNRDNLFSLATKTLGDLTRNTFKIIVCIFSTYFLFRHGEGLGDQISRACLRLGGPQANDLLPRVRWTVRATVYGLVVTAIVQAILASLGFWVAGVSYPLLLGALVFLLSFIPFGPPIVWLPAALVVLSDGRIGWGIFLLIWGGGVVSSMDNILRPIFIGKAASLPILLVFIGVIGGVMAFGMVGLFTGPVVVAVALALWQDWVKSHGDASGERLIPALIDLAASPSVDDPNETESRNSPPRE